MLSSLFFILFLFFYILSLLHLLDVLDHQHHQYLRSSLSLPLSVCVCVCARDPPAISGPFWFKQESADYLLHRLNTSAKQAKPKVQPSWRFYT